MATRLKCTFKRVNGDLTGVYARPKAGDLSKNRGILYMKNCPDGKTFYCDPEAEGNIPSKNWYKVINPTDYKLPDEILYVRLLTSYCKWETEDVPDEDKEVNEDAEAVEQVEEELKEAEKVYKENPSAPLVSFTNIEFNSFNSDNIWMARAGVTTSEAISKDTYVDPKSKISSVKDKSFDTYKMESSRIFDNKSGMRYFNDYSSVEKNLNKIRNNLNLALSPASVNKVRTDYINNFNHYKIAHPDMQLTKSFTHVFFTRPDLNFFTNDGKPTNIINDNTFFYFYKNYPELMKSLTSDFTSKHNFNPYLYNMSQSFDFSDEFIKSGEHGETFTGYKTKYGKNKIESITANNFSISYTDDYDLRVYKVHKMWVDYISKVFRGEFSPKKTYIYEKTLDYACSVYVIICGPDGESILFWTKYTGVFPTNIPSSAFNWSKGNMMKMPEYSINYEYSWKEDFNPVALAEFNINSNLLTINGYTKTTSNGSVTVRYNKYDKTSKPIKVYEPLLGSTGKTFAGAPYIEQVDRDEKYRFKLRFKSLT